MTLACLPIYAHRRNVRFDLVSVIPLAVRSEFAVLIRGIRAYSAQ